MTLFFPEIDLKKPKQKLSRTTEEVSYRLKDSSEFAPFEALRDIIRQEQVSEKEI